jgi:hypothetical protein
MRLSSLAAGLGWIVLVACQLATAQQPQWWIDQKKACGLSAGQDYASWAQSGYPCGAKSTGSTASGGLTPQQQMGLAIGKAAMPYVQQAVHNFLYGAPTVQSQLDPAQQQRELAAQQLNNSGIYLLRQRDYAGAINEFQKALAITPNDATIAHNLALAKQQLKDGAAAAKTSGVLGQFLGNTPAGAGYFDFDQLTHSSVANPNGSVLGLVNLDAGVVDLRGATSTSPQSLASQLDGILAKTAPAPPSPRSDVVLPQDKDMELLFDAGPLARSNVVLPQDKDMELLFDAGPPSSARSNIVLPQDKDMELLFPSSPPALKSAPAPASGQPHN